MDPILFNSIQSKFKTFLVGKLHPLENKKKSMIKEEIIPVESPRKIRKEIERTSAFGSEDAGL